MLNQNPTYDYFINSNFSPDSNSLNFNYILDGGSTINNYQELGFQKLVRCCKIKYRKFIIRIKNNFFAVI